MKAGSLRLRLLGAASLSLLTALFAIGVLLVWVFERHVRDQMAADLGHQLNQLAALTVPAPGDTLKVDGDMTDPRFDQPLGGLYWQIDREDKPIARSRSLWDATLDLRASKVKPGALAVLELAGPGGSHLLAASKRVQVAANKASGYRLTVAADLKDLDAGRRGLIQTLVSGLSIAFAILVLAAWAQVKFGLKPLEAVRAELEAIRAGRADSVATQSFPTEVQPLADEINRFLGNQRTSIERSRWRASDLAHGLKTPLAAMAAIADDLRRSGNTGDANSLKAGIESMQRHIERQLALARSQGGASGFTPRVGARIESMLDVMRKLPTEHEIVWTVAGDTTASIQMNAEDFDEVVGNLLDNARKWAQASVSVDIASAHDCVTICVSDDGPGIAPGDIAHALQRGTRLDERVPGSGIGLSIVQTILETYTSALRMQSSAAGGLEATFSISSTV